MDPEDSPAQNERFPAHDHPPATNNNPMTTENPNNEWNWENVPVHSSATEQTNTSSFSGSEENDSKVREQELSRLREEAEREASFLRGQFDSKTITKDELNAKLRDLMIQDDNGIWWSVGVKSGDWYKHDTQNDTWNLGKPPFGESKKEESPKTQDTFTTSQTSTENSNLLASLIRGDNSNPRLGKMEDASLQWFEKNAPDVIDHPLPGLSQTDIDAFKKAWDEKKNPGSSKRNEPSPTTPLMSKPEDLLMEHPVLRKSKPTREERMANRNIDDEEVEKDNSGGRRDKAKTPFVDERILDLSEKSERLAAVQALLDKLEVSERSVSQHPQEIRIQVDYLKQEWAGMMADPDNENREGLDADILWQAVSRLRVHEFYCSLKGLNIYSDEAKKNIEGQLAALASIDIPGGIDCAVLIKGKIDTIPGFNTNPFESLELMRDLPVGDMMQRLQEIAVNGMDINGTTRFWNGNERSLSAPDLLRVKAKVKEGLGGDPKTAETAYRLASRLFFILGEVGVCDIPVIGPDGKILKAPEGPLGKMAYFEEARLAALGKRQSADDIGPWLTQDLIPVLCSGALQMATYVENGDPDKKIHLANEPLWQIITDKTADPVARKEALKKAYIFDPLSPDRSLLDFKRLDYEKLENAFLENYWKKTLPTRLKVRSWYLETEWNPEDLKNTDKLEDIRTTLAQVEGALQPRQALLYGIISQAAINMHGKLETKGTLFDYPTWYDVKRKWTEGPGAVISPEQWDSVIDLCTNPPEGAQQYDTNPKINQRLLISETLVRVIPTSR